MTSFYEDEGYKTLLEWCEAKHTASFFEDFNGERVRYFKVPTPRVCSCCGDNISDDEEIPDSLVRIFIGDLSPAVWVSSISEARNTVRNFYEKNGHLEVK